MTNKLYYFIIFVFFCFCHWMINICSCLLVTINKLANISFRVSYTIFATFIVLPVFAIMFAHTSFHLFSFIRHSRAYTYTNKKNRKQKRNKEKKRKKKKSNKISNTKHFETFVVWFVFCVLFSSFICVLCCVLSVRNE